MSQVMKIEGNVQGHHLYSAGGYLYQFKITLADGDQRVRCNKWRTKGIDCPSLGTICHKTHLLFATKHACVKDPLEVDEILLRNQLKHEVVRDLVTPLSTIFTRISANFENAVSSRVKFSSVRGNLSLLRSKKIESNGEEEEGERNNNTDEEDDDDVDVDDDVAPDVDEEPRPCGSGRKRKVSNKCSICLKNIRGNPVINIPCGHGFCKKCSIAALNIKKSCPNCRKGVKRTITYYKSYIIVFSFLSHAPGFNFIALFYGYESITVFPQ